MKRLVMICVLLGACSSASISPEMQAVADGYFKAISSERLEDALDLYDSHFYAQTPRQQWHGMLRGVSKKLGKLQSQKLIGWRVHNRVGTGAGTFLELSYEVQYEKYPAREFIVVRRPLTGGEPKILSHQINSAGLLLE
jgi:hypothetical protein